MKQTLLALLFGLISYTAQAEEQMDKPWVLLGLDIHMGSVFARDTSRDVSRSIKNAEGLPVYTTEATCTHALRHALKKYAGRSHADGNLGRYRCVNWQTWESEP